MPYLVDLDHHLRRIGRNDKHVRMGLYEKPSFFLVRVAQILARFNRLRKAGIEILRLCNADAVRAASAEVRQSVIRQGFLQAVHRPRQHQSQRVLARSLHARNYYAMRKALTRQHLAHAMNRLRVTGKIRKRHIYIDGIL